LEFETVRTTCSSRSSLPHIDSKWKRKLKILIPSPSSKMACRYRR
ncbi:hypothetical protein GE061_007716, partial [Apolygus lucorum]